MSYRVTELNGIKTYNLSYGKTLPQFMREDREKLKNNQEYKNRIELIQDFDFNISCQQVAITEDQNHIIASGIYAPQVKVYDLKELSLKCLRGMDSEVLKLKMLSNDYTKFVAGCQDRALEFHAQYGKHYRIRVPRNILNIDYDPFNCDLFTSCNNDEIYRLNLEEGVFLQPFQSENSNVYGLQFNPYLNILMAGGDQGVLEIFDYKQRKKVNRVEMNKGISCIKSQQNGLQYLVGQQDGKVKLYDLRYNQQPILTIQHQYRQPINTLEFHEKTNNIISSDQKVIKLTNMQSGNNFSSIEPGYNINMFTLAKDSGLFIVAGENSRIGQFFMPSLDNAPKWCPFIENITEELEENNTQLVYDEFKFLTVDDLEQLGATNLIGGKMLKNYMHGYLIHLKLYNKLKMVSDPFKHQEYRKQQIKQKMDKSRGQRIVIKNKSVKKVNQQFYEELKKKGNKKTGDVDYSKVLDQDDRFGALFSNNSFAIDRESDNYRVNHPSEQQQQVVEYTQEKTKDRQKVDRKTKVIKKKQMETFEDKLKKSRR